MHFGVSPIFVIGVFSLFLQEFSYFHNLVNFNNILVLSGFINNFL